MNHLRNIQNKIGSLNDLKKKLENRKAQNKKVVFTNGCFDLLHRGHLTYLAEAADQGNFLVIGLNSDRSVKELKGPKRPIHNENDRAFQLAALEFVDFVVIFDDPTPLHLIENINPDVLVKGGDYNAEETNPNNPDYIVGSDFVKSQNHKVAVIPFIDGYSSTKIINRIQS